MPYKREIVGSNPTRSIRDIMIYYAIRQKSTGFFLPEVGSCYTRSEPTDIKEKTPRLFLKESSAKSALFYWLHGVYISKYSYGGYEDGSSWDGFEVNKVDGRNKDDMEIVKFHLCEIK